MRRALLGILLIGTVGSRAWGAAPVPVDPRADFLKLIDRPRVPLEAALGAETTGAGVTETRLTYMVEKGQQVPGIVIKSAGAKGRLPVVIALHGTGGKKEDERNLLRTLAGRGFLGVAIDGRYHGERAANAPKEPGMNAYDSAVYHAWINNDPSRAVDREVVLEHPFFFDEVWDVMRLVDYLETRDDVDAKHIGVYGVSKGGVEAYLTAAVDPRIAAAVPCISVESFKWADDNDMWQHRIETIQKSFDAAAKQAGVKGDAAFVHQFYARVAPGIEGEFDGPSMTPLIAPRALMAINGEKDPRTPPASLKLATDAIQAAYHKLNADDHFTLLVQPNTAHKVTADAEKAGVEFLVKWLKTDAAKTPALNAQEATQTLQALADKYQVTVNFIHDRDSTMEMSMHTTTARMGRFLAELTTTNLQPVDLQIASLKPGQDDLTVRLVLAPAGVSRADFVACLHDLTQAFPLGPNEVWATGIAYDPGEGRWHLTGMASAAAHIDTLTANMKQSRHFSDITAGETQKSDDDLLQFSLTFGYKN